MTLVWTANGSAIRTGLRAVLDWWGRELAACLPQRMRLRGSGTVSVEIRGRCVSVRRQGRPPMLVPLSDALDAATAARLKSLLAGSRDVVLTVPADMAVRAPLDLPAAAEGHLLKAALFELDRRTPFTPDKAHVSHHVLRRDRANGRIEAEIVAVPKCSLSGAERVLADAGVPATAIDVRFTDGTIRIPIAGTDRPATVSRNAVIMLALAAVFFAAAAGLRLAQWNQAESLFLERLSAMEPRIVEARTLRRRADEGRAQLAGLAAARAEGQQTRLILGEITHLVPDDTWLTELRLDGDQVHLMAEGSSAAAVARNLQSSPLFSSVAFSGPVTPSAAGERFRLTLTRNLMAVRTGEDGS